MHTRTSLAIFSLLAMSVLPFERGEYFMLISDAYADAPAATTTATGTSAFTPAAGGAPVDTPSPLSGMGIFVFFIAALYFFMIRPNQKKIKEYEAMIKALRRGDRVVTGGGIIGVISKIENDDVLVVEIAPDIKVRVMRETISNVVSKTAVNDNKADEKPGKKSDDKASNS
jgi:preprotein translocase subunit YajC